MNKRSNNDDAAEDFAEGGGFFERMGRIWQRWWVRIPVVLALIGGLVGGGLWAVGKIERRQSRKLTEMAANYLQEGKAEEARMGLETALSLDPRNAKALRMLAGLRRAQGADAEALDAMRRLAESGQMSLDDLVIYTQMAARAGDLALAERLANSAGSGGNTVLRHMLRAELGAAKNDPEAVEKELRAAAEADESGQSKLTLARFLIQRRLNAETAPEVLAMLRGLSSKNDALGAEALGCRGVAEFMDKREDRDGDSELPANARVPDDDECEEGDESGLHPDREAEESKGRHIRHHMDRHPVPGRRRR